MGWYYLFDLKKNNQQLQFHEIFNDLQIIRLPQAQMTNFAVKNHRFVEAKYLLLSLVHKKTDQFVILLWNNRKPLTARIQEKYLMSFKKSALN